MGLFWEYSSFYVEGFDGYEVASKYHKFLRSLPTDVRNINVNKTTTLVTDKIYANQDRTRMFHTILLTYEILAYGEDKPSADAEDIVNEDVE